MGDLVWVKISFPKPLVIDFSLTCKGVTFFFSVGYFFFPRCFLAIIFSLEISLQDIFFGNHPYQTPPHLKSQMVGPTASYVNL